MSPMELNRTIRIFILDGGCISSIVLRNYDIGVMGVP